MRPFTHLHVHSHYSVLDGMSKVPEIVDKCMANGMFSVALTDHGVMYGVKELHDYAAKVNGKTRAAIREQEALAADASSSEAERAAARAKAGELRGRIFKPIFGVEAYCARRGLADKDKSLKARDPETGRESQLDRGGWHLVLLAKNKTGYRNLCKMVSISWIDGFYGKPRVDKALLEKYHEGVICTSACLGGEIPQLVMSRRLDEAEASVRWFKGVFGDDYYLELQRHPCLGDNPARDVWERQQEVNPLLVDLARRVGVKLVCTNDSHFLDRDMADAHDRLVCLSTGRTIFDKDRLFYTRQEWLKTPDEMEALFADIPEALDNTMEVAAKVEDICLDSDPIMPRFPIPEEFGTEEEYRARLSEQELFDEFTRDEKGNVVLSQDDAERKIKKLGGYDKLYRIKLEADYLAKMAWEGARRRYGEQLTEAQREQIAFELHIMKTMGFPGYFLIVMDFIRAAREELDVWVGPGRGSAAGSVVAYCLGITDIDPLKYDLLFERFLNPDRISLPDIDTDFADDGRQKVIEWVTRKYGEQAVAHIITYGGMAAKSAIKDVARTQGMPLQTVYHLVGLVPDRFPDGVTDPKTGKVPKVNLRNCYKFVPELRQALEGPDQEVSTVLRHAAELDGTVRQTGVHACGIIIGADDLTNYAPITVVEDKETGFKMQATQYDGHYVESVGLIKMDFLGLINLRIMKDAVRNVKARTGRDIDLAKIPIDDPAVYRLYSEGRTMGIFQFESPGMQKYLKELQPTVFEDLIAMNALYRPGPMDYIPQFINRKQGREPITYDLPCMEKYLRDTYGVTVYQEQVMLLSRLLAGFTRGESDKLRKAMGKKQIAVLNELRPKFISQGERNGHPAEKLEKIWADWEKFASYAFNKSHATCYSWVSYQTAWLKTHYPAEYMAALLTSCKGEIKAVTKYMDECRSMGLNVHGPDVNNSVLDFGVAQDGSVVFGLGGVKGVGEGAVEAIVGERRANGPFRSVFDFVERVDMRACNRKAVESLALAGAFDSLGDTRREQFFAQNKDGLSGSEILAKYGASYQADKSAGQNSLFGGMLDAAIAKPELPEVANPWSDLERLNQEKEVVGMYISSHPLASYSIVLRYLVNMPIAELKRDNFPQMVGKTFTCAGIVTGVKSGLTRATNKPYLIATIEDMDGAGELALFGEDYVNYSPYFATPNAFIYVTGKIEKGQYNDRVFMKIVKVDFLADVLKHGTVRNVTFTLDLEKLTPPLVEMFADVLRPNKPAAIGGAAVVGKPVVPVRFHVVCRPLRIDVSLSSQNHSVELGPELVKMVDSTEGAVVMSVNER